MTEIDPRFFKVCNRAKALMDSPQNCGWTRSSEAGKSILRIRYYPSFEPMIVWDVAIGVGASQWTRASVCEMTWDRPTDGKRFVDPSFGFGHALKLRDIPSISVRRAMFEEFEILDRMMRIDFQKFDHQIGQGGIWLDGNHYYLEVKPGDTVLKFHWEASSAPAAWEPLIRWSEDTAQLLLGKLSNRPVEKLQDTD